VSEIETVSVLITDEIGRNQKIINICIPTLQIIHEMNVNNEQDRKKH